MPSWKKVIVSGSDALLNTLTVTNGITGSLHGTASWAENSITSSYSLSALSSSYAVTASYVLNAVSASYATTASYASNALSSSYALTASYTNPLYQTVAVSGSIRFDPTQDPDLAGSDLDSTFLFQSASNTALGYDLYVRQNGNLTKWKWVEGLLESGLLYGGIVTYSGSNVFVSSGSGIIVDHNATTGSEIGPIVDYVTWGPITQSITNITSSQVTYLYINDTGSLQQQSTRFTSEQYHNYIPLGAVGHFDFTQVSAFGGAVRTSYDQISQISDFVGAFGPLKVSGYGITGQSGSLRVSVSSGRSFIHGGFYSENPEFPSNIDTNVQATASIAYVYRSGSGVQFDTNGGNLYTAVRPGLYDDGSGTPAAVSGGDYTIQRVFSDPKTGVLYIYYGQKTYGNLSQALADFATDPFTEGDTFNFTTFIGSLILKGNTTNIVNTADNKIIPAGLFRGSGGGSGGGGGADALDDLSDVSIVSPVNGQALVYDSGVWENGYPTSASFATSASYAENSTSASFATNASSSLIAITASYALFAANGGGGGGGSTVTHNQPTASTTWSFSHNLNTLTPLLQVYNLGYEQIIPNEIVSINAFTSEIRFDYSQSGYAVASTGGSLAVTGSTPRLVQTIAATTWSFAHNLGTKYPGFEVFDSNDDVVIPAGIHVVDENNAEIYFAIPSTGVAIANFSGIEGIFPSASFAATASYSDAFSIGGTLTRYATVTSSINGSNIVFNQPTGSYTSAFFKYTVASGSNARSGEVTSVWNGTTVEFTDTSTTDIGTTTVVTSSVALSGANIRLNMQTNTSGWRIKSVATFM